jgi:hypothetical protein
LIEDPDKVVASAFLRILAETIDCDTRLPCFLDYAQAQFNDLRIKAGCLGPPDWKWLAQHVDTEQQQRRLAKALMTVCLWCCSQNRSGKALPAHRIAISTAPTKYFIALVWTIAPAIFDGISLHELAKRLDIHCNTMSVYAAQMSRISGYRSHAQSKGWNFNPDKAGRTA